MLLPKICELFSIPPLNRPIGEVPYEAERVKRAGGMVVKWDGTQRVGCPAFGGVKQGGTKGEKM